jgi:hypothetical protein
MARSSKPPIGEIVTPPGSSSGAQLRSWIKTLRYLDELDQADEQEPEEKKPTAQQLQEKIEEMKRQRAVAERTDKELEESGESQISLTDLAQRSWMIS